MKTVSLSHIRAGLILLMLGVMLFTIVTCYEKFTYDITGYLYLLNIVMLFGFILQSTYMSPQMRRHFLQFVSWFTLLYIIFMLVFQLLQYKEIIVVDPQEAPNWNMLVFIKTFRNKILKQIAISYLIFPFAAAFILFKPEGKPPTS